MQNLTTGSERDKNNIAAAPDESGAPSTGFSNFTRGLSSAMRTVKEIVIEFLSFAALLTLMSLMLAYCA